MYVANRNRKKKKTTTKQPQNQKTRILISPERRAVDGAVLVVAHPVDDAALGRRAFGRAVVLVAVQANLAGQGRAGQSGVKAAE